MLLARRCQLAVGRRVELLRLYIRPGSNRLPSPIGLSYLQSGRQGIRTLKAVTPYLFSKQVPHRSDISHQQCCMAALTVIQLPPERGSRTPVHHTRCPVVVGSKQSPVLPDRNTVGGVCRTRTGHILVANQVLLPDELRPQNLFKPTINGFVTTTNHGCDFSQRHCFMHRKQSAVCRPRIPFVAGMFRLFFLRVWASNICMSGFGFRVLYSGFRFRVSGFRFQVRFQVLSFRLPDFRF